MKNVSVSKLSVVGVIAVLLTACVGGGEGYRAEVTNESYKEDYQAAKPVVVEPAMTQPTAMVEPVQNTVVGTRSTTVMPAPSQKKVKLLPPTPKQAALKRFGYTIQVIAMDSEKNAMAFANQLPSSQPVWQHYKKVNGTDWYTLLYGDYPTKQEAKAAIQTLPRYFQDLKPFVKSIDDLKDSSYPQLKMLR